MNYTATFSYQLATKDGTHLIKKEYVYDDVPYTIDKIYKNLIDRLRGVTDHFLYPANDKQVIDINSRVMIKLKEYTPNIAASSGYLQITLKNVDPNKVSTIFRIPRNEFELYTLVSLVQYVLDAKALQTNIDIIQNAKSIYYTDHDYSKVSVFIDGIVFDITRTGKTFVCKPRIKGCDLEAPFDDIADYQIVAHNMYKKIKDDQIVSTTLLEMFPNMVFDIELQKSLSLYTYRLYSEDALVKISYVGPHNVHVKLLNSIEHTTTLEKCKTVITDLTTYGINKLTFLKQNIR